MIVFCFSGICSSCKNSLSRIALTPEEFVNLQKAFNDKVVVDENIFMGSNPEETARFYSIIKGRQFDFVIDGLNVAFQSRGVA